MTIISNDQDISVELIHCVTDPSMWIVRRWRKVVWFKKRISSDWFNDERQAISFASASRRTRFAAHATSYRKKENEDVIRNQGLKDSPLAGVGTHWQDDGGEGG